MSVSSISNALLPLHRVLILSGLLILCAVVGVLAKTYQFEYIYDENNLLENTQVVFLCLACIGFAWSGRGLQAKHRVVAAFLSLLMFAFIFRELDIERLEGMPSWAVYFFADDGRIVYLLPLVGLFAWMMRDLRFYIRHWSRYLSTTTAFYMVCAVVCLVVFSTAFDRKLVTVAHTGMWEESFEVIATTLLFATSLIFNRDMKSVEQS